MDTAVIEQAIEGGVSASELLRLFDEDVETTEEEEKPSLVERFFSFVGGEHVKAAIKRENGIDFPARDFAYVPDPNAPSTWKLRLTESPGKVTIAQLGRAAAAFSPGGFRGNKVDIPTAAISAVKRRIRAEYRKFGVSEDKIPMSVKELGGNFAVWKQKDGQYRWFAVYSNNFRDDDNPPEIISEMSHKTFVEMVDKGIVDYPELWHWHIPGTRWGVADWLDYADGFALASGTVDPGHEKEAESLAEMGEIGVSHGMPEKFLLRDENDPSVITLHVTREISPLPRWAAANKLTTFHVFKGDEDMGLNAQKREHLTNLGIPEDKIAELEKSLVAVSEMATSEGVESKEAAPTDETTSAVVEPIQETDAVQEAPTYVTREQLASVISEVLEAVTKQNGELADAIKSLSGDLAVLKQADEVRVQKAARQTPALSLSELIGLTPQADKEAKIDGRSQLARSKPEEARQPSRVITGVPFIDNLVVGADIQQ